MNMSCGRDTLPSDSFDSDFVFIISRGFRSEQGCSPLGGGGLGGH